MVLLSLALGLQASRLKAWGSWAQHSGGLRDKSGLAKDCRHRLSIQRVNTLVLH